MRLRAKRDGNEPAIVDALEKTGWLVHRLNDPAVPDLLAYQPRSGRWALVEVKGKRGRLTAPQKAFHGKWPVAIIRTVDEAIQLGRFASGVGTGGAHP